MSPRDTVVPSAEPHLPRAARAALWLGGAVLIGAAAALWLRMADAVFLERLIASLAGCF